jgi:hypothetical protein
MGLAGLAGRAAGAGGLGRGGGWVGPSGSAQLDRFFFFFSEINSSAKTITVKSSKCLQGTKNTQKITKISGKFLEID